MTILAYALLATATSSGGVAPVDGVRWAQLTIRQTVVIRVPSAPPPPPQMKLRWKEKKGPKCIAVNTLGGYAITQPDSIDLIVRGGQRYRAQLEDACPAIAFYSGFYIRPHADGRVCQGRDMVHSRAGGQCAIERFRTLVPRALKLRVSLDFVKPRQQRRRPLPHGNPDALCRSRPLR